MSNKPEHSRKKVCYYYDGNIGQYYYGQGHPMKPHRITMTHSLVLNYGMYKSMHILKPPRLPAEEMTTYHSDDYINLLKNLTGNEVVDNKYAKEMYKYNIGNECPAFEGLFEFCQISAGGSVQAAKHLNKGTYDIGINWAGGLHHAKTSEAAGFCYVNDVVLAILELLKVHQRVLYIDIDIHHGDGVEEAFYTTDRVMTLSFHQYGHHFFPATGVTSDFGAGKGRYYSVNVPLGIGIDDESFESIFNPVVTRVMDMYRPNAIVMQCGADSLAGDRLGSFNLTVHGHGKCVSFVKKYEFPLLLLGGGGYKLPTVARTWAYETAVAVSKEKDISNILPFNDYYEYYGPEFKLQITPSNMINQNSKESLDRLTSEVFDNLRMLSFAPSVQFQPIPNDAVTSKIQKLVKDKYDEPRITQSHAHLVQDNEFSDSEDEGDERRDKSNYTYGSNKDNATIGDTSSEVDQTIQDSVDETKDQIMEDNANEVPLQKMEEIAYTAVIAFLEGSCASESESEDFSPTLEFTADVAEPLLMLGDIKRMGDFKYEPGNQTEDDYEDSNQTLKGTNEASNINKQSVDHLTNEAVNLIVKNTVSEASNQYLRNTTNEAFNCNAGNQTQLDTSEASIINKQSGHYFMNGAISLNVKDTVSEASNQYLENAANEAFTCSQSIQIQGSGNGASTSRITVEEANSKDSLNQITPLTTISKLPGEKDEDDPKASSKSQNECKDEARSYRMSDLMELLANSGPGVEDNTITFSSEVTEGEMSSLGVPAIIAGPETGEGNYAAFEGTSTPQQGLSYIDTLDLENISDEEFF